MKKLTVERFDRMTEKLTPQRDCGVSGYEGTGKRSTLATESLWGAESIAKFMGVSSDYVRKLSRRDDNPIREKGGRYFCTRTEIVVWLSSRDRI